MDTAEVRLVDQIIRFVGWLGEGRKLTQTGRLRLADARELVELLGTADRIDPQIGGRVFRTKSSDDLPELTTILEWAKASRLVRVNLGRLVPVKKSAALLGRPDELWTRLFDAFGQLGPVVCPEAWIESILRLTFAQCIDEVLRLLASREKGMPVDELGEAAWRVGMTGYVIDGTPEQVERARQANDRDLQIALDWLHRLGVLRADGDRYTLTDLGRRGVDRLRGAPDPGAPVLRLRVTLTDTHDPEVWRRILVPAAIPLNRLHEVIQVAMGWQNYHLHEFTAGTGPDVVYGRPDPELPHLDDRAVTLATVVAEHGDRLGYTYDFGDYWRHEITVELHTTAKVNETYPACTAGEGACPPEDCGGTSGYEELRLILIDPDNDEHDDRLRWLGLTTAADFNPASLDLHDINVKLAAVRIRPST
ncbi:hypothetical protein BCD48_43530 [Pseudofrankia sp. BMG5.36]|nr:hypothetical protein BCD48_43530 [Pseudofrankia sp. BMG5.36]